MANAKICSIKFENQDIINVIKAFDPFKAHEKIFERLISDSLYQFLKEHNLLSIHQSGYRSNVSCINQLLFIVHTLYKAFDAYPTLDARGVFLDMSKAFDKVWHEGLIYKLKSMGV